MNVRQSSTAVVTHGNKMGMLAHVLWQEAVHPELGAMWRVRFQEPQLFTRVSADGGASFQDGIEFSKDALMPDAWLKLAKPLVAVPLNIDLDPSPPKLAPALLDVPLTWPSGWLEDPLTE